MFLKEERVTPPERQAAMPEVLEDYKAQHMRLVAQSRELERLRRQVRSSAEREAAAIVTAARRDVRQVLVEARRELLVLVAQLQAVGCDTPGQELPGNTVEGRATESIAAAPSNAPQEPFGASEIVTTARRDVREVLVEAQTELVALAEEARELRARISGHQEFTVEPVRSRAAVTEESHQILAPLVPAQPVEQFTTSEHDPLGSPSRLWLGVAAAVAFATIGLVFFVSNRGSGASANAAAVQASGPRAGTVKPQDAAAKTTPAAASAATPAPARVSSAVSLEIDARRPAWIRTIVDGRGDIGRTFAAGEKRTVSANREIVVRAGDAGAVYVALNGGAAKALGGDGQVITRRFGVPVASRQPAVLQTTAESPSTPAGLRADAPPADVGTAGVAEAAPVPPVATAEREILRETQRWFEAYFGGDTEGMGTIATTDFSLVDERPENQRLPVTMRGVERGLQQVRIEVAGDGAVISARMTERTSIDGRSREYVSLVSGVWIRSEGRWRLTSVRFVNPGSIGPLH